MLCTVLVKFNNSILRNILDKQEAGDGVIVFVASQAALIGIYGLAAYCGSKYAVRGFAEALAMEVRWEDDFLDKLIIDFLCRLRDFAY